METKELEGITFTGLEPHTNFSHKYESGTRLLVTSIYDDDETVSVGMIQYHEGEWFILSNNSNLDGGECRIRESLGFKYSWNIELGDSSNAMVAPITEEWEEIEKKIKEREKKIKEEEERKALDDFFKIDSSIAF